MKVPFDNEESSGIVYVWIGSKADPDEARLIQEIAEEMFNNVSISLAFHWKQKPANWDSTKSVQSVRPNSCDHYMSFDCVFGRRHSRFVTEGHGAV
jgi:hypothetical protein